MTMLSLTPDVLSDIFLLVQASHHRITKLPHHVTVSHVNRAWRVIALSTPMLWADIQISQRSNVDALSEFISRARSCELDINVIPNSSLPLQRGRSRNFANARSIFSPLIDHLSRWRGLYISADGKILADVISSIVKLQFSNLQHFELVNTGSGPVPHFGPFHFDPRVLITLRLHRATVHVSSRTQFESLRTLEFSQISCCMIDQASLDSLSDADNATHEPTMLNLRRLEISVTVPALPTHPSFRSSTLVFVKFAGFSNTSENSVPSLINLFNSVSSPNLKHLELDSITNFAWTAFIASLQSSTVPKYPSLESLTLRSLELEDLNLRFISAFPAIKYLRLASVDPETIFRLLKDHPLLWPEARLIIEPSRSVGQGIASDSARSIQA